jgi:uncharacterized membrane protein YdcZ (DUF606 family)
MCAVPNMEVFCSSLTSWFPGTMLLLLLLLLFKITATENDEADHREFLSNPYKSNTYV